MNYEQVTGLIRQILPVVGGVAIAFGWLTKDQVGTLVTNVAAAAGPLMIIGSTIWSLVNKTDKAIVAAANALPQVQGVVTKPTEEGRELAASVPSSTVVSAGTPAAKSIATGSIGL